MSKLMHVQNIFRCGLAICAAFLVLQANAYAQVREFDANQAEGNPGDVVRLEDQLINGLRVVTSEQRAYVLQVVALVEQGTLPRAMVNVVYSWAIKRNPRVPLPYFQFALKALADRRGINVPAGQFVINQ
jgi:hypothetical protein